MPYQIFYNELTPEQIQEHADWYESIVIVDKFGNPLEPVLTDDPTPDPEGDSIIDEGGL